MRVFKIKIIPILLVVFIIMATLACLTVDASDNGQYEDEAALNNIIDTVGILGESEYYDLSEKAMRISDKYRVGVYIIIIDDYNYFGYNVEDAAENIYYDYGFGYPPTKNGGDNEGVLFLMSMSDRDYDINTHGYKANNAITSAGFSYLDDSFKPDFKDDNWYAGFVKYLDAMDYVLEKAESGEHLSNSKNTNSVFIVAAIIIVAIIGAFTNVSMLRKKLISVKTASTASNYIDGDVDMSVKTDRYLYTTTQVIEHSDNNRGGGGGSSHHSGKF